MREGGGHMSQEFTEFLELFGCWGGIPKHAVDTLIFQWILCLSFCLSVFCPNFCCCIESILWSRLR